MKQSKKIFATATILLFLFMLIPISASAATKVANGTCGADGDNLTWLLDSDGVLTISGDGTMKDYDIYYNKMPWNDLADTITSVNIEEGVTSIGECAFYECMNLSDVSIPQSITYIGERAFYGCKALATAILPDSITYIGDSVFAFCTSLIETNLPEQITHIGDNLFLCCSSITEITIPNTVTSIGDSAFSYCIMLTQIALPDILTSIGDQAFSSCNALTSITIPKNVSQIGEGVFAECINLEQIIVDDFNVNYVSIDNVLYDNNITSILAYPAKKTETIFEIPIGITRVGFGAFSNNKSLTNVTIPDTVTSIGEAAFSYCTALTSITIPNSVKIIEEYAFNSCYRLTDIMLSDGITQIETLVFGFCSPTEIIIPDSVKSIDSYAFSNCDELISITIPKSVETIHEKAFNGCENITIYGFDDSYAETFANENNIQFIILGDLIVHIDTPAKFAQPQIEITDDSNMYFGTIVWLPEIQETFAEATEYTANVVLYANDGYQFKETNTVVVENAKINNLELSDDGKKLSFAATFQKTDSCLHENTMVQNGIEKTCTSDGYTGDVFCSECGNVIQTGTWNFATGHVYTKVVTEPTCVDRGYTTYICFCGDSYTGDYVNATGNHNYTAQITLPTCVDKGYTTYICECGFSYKGDYTEIEKDNHIYDDDSDETCNICGEVREIGGDSVINTNTGATLDTAVRCKLDVQYHKTWTTAFRSYFSVFTIPEKGIVTVSVTKPLDHNYDNGDIYFEIRNSNGTSITGYNCRAEDNIAFDTYQYQVGLEAGTYYLEMKPAFVTLEPSIYSSSYSYYTISFAPSDYCEIEPNAEASQATPLVNDKMCKGFLNSGDSEESDYYIFNAIKGHKYRIVLDNYGEINSTTAILDLIGKETVYILRDMAYNIDENGEHYYTFIAPESKPCYLFFHNYSGKQLEYGITVTDFNHVHEYNTSVTAPTCMAEGYTTYSCSCGHSFTSDYTGYGDHVYDAIVTDPTCIAQGYTTYICSCGHSYADDYTGVNESHNWEKNTVASPNCGYNGYAIYTCTDCGISILSDYTPAVGSHVYTNENDDICNACGKKRIVVGNNANYSEITPMYRLYNPNSGEHFYTGSAEEGNNLIIAGWLYEGIAWNAPVNGGTPIYRLYNPNNGDHHYTGSVEERNNLASLGWQYEGVCWNSASADEKSIPQYRLFNPNADCGSHHYTGSTDERDYLVSLGWHFEGIGWFGMLN